MSETETTGVVDRHCKVFGVSNLFVGGSSVFATSGAANPTLTIVALALRLAEHLHQVVTRDEAPEDTLKPKEK
jgi:choline dehydrogenase-like flavoprotein